MLRAHSKFLTLTSSVQEELLIPVSLSCWFDGGQELSVHVGGDEQKYLFRLQSCASATLQLRDEGEINGILNAWNDFIFSLWNSF